MQQLAYCETYCFPHPDSLAISGNHVAGLSFLFQRSFDNAVDPDEIIVIQPGQPNAECSENGAAPICRRQFRCEQIRRIDP